MLFDARSRRVNASCDRIRLPRAGRARRPRHLITGAAGIRSPSCMAQDDDVFIFATSSAQRRLWLLDQLNPGNPAYNIPAVVRCRGPLDVDAVEQAVNAVIARHETLRTNFLLIDDEPRQLVAVSRSLAARIVTLEPCGDLEPHDIEAVAGEIDAETLRPFDLAAGALIRVVVYRLRADDHLVQITLHHIVAD